MGDFHGAKADLIHELTRFGPATIITYGSVNRQDKNPSDLDVIVVSSSEDASNRFRINSELLHALPDIYYTIVGRRRLYSPRTLSPLVDIYVYNREELSSFFTSLGDRQFHEYLTTSGDVQIVGENCLSRIKQNCDVPSGEVIEELYSALLLRNARSALVKSEYTRRFDPIGLNQAAHASKVVVKRFMYHVMRKKGNGLLQQTGYDTRNPKFADAFVALSEGRVDVPLLDDLDPIGTLVRANRFGEDCLNLLAA